MGEYKRPTWDEYFIEIMETVGKRATCDRNRSGAVIARDNVLLSTGYVGAPTGSPDCDTVGHLMKGVLDDDGTVSRHCMRTAHAEANAICQAAKNGVAIKGATIYCRMVPCRNCAMMIANSGIKKVIVKMNYHGSSADESKEILKNAGVELVMMTDEKPTYKDQ
jgi:dCMP deaminase